VSVVNDVGGPVTSTSNVQLVAVPGQQTEGLKATQVDQLTSVILFKGTSNELDVDVLAPPQITAVATGQPGGAAVTYDEPVLRVSQGGKVLGTLDATSAHQTITVPGVATLSIGTLTKQEAPDGTSASGSAALLDVKVGTDPSPAQLVGLTIAGASAAAAVPAGGIACAAPPPAPATGTATGSDTGGGSGSASGGGTPGAGGSGGTATGGSAGPQASSPATSTLAFTGGQPLAPYGLGLLIASAAIFGWRRRARAL
jgi:hypothetical protein